MINTPALTESLENIFLEQLGEERYPSQIQVLGLNNKFDPGSARPNSKLIEELAARKKAYCVQQPGRRRENRPFRFVLVTHHVTA